MGVTRKSSHKDTRETPTLQGAYLVMGTLDVARYILSICEKTLKLGPKCGENKKRRKKTARRGGMSMNDGISALMTYGLNIFMFCLFIIHNLVSKNAKLTIFLVLMFALVQLFNTSGGIEFIRGIFSPVKPYSVPEKTIETIEQSTEEKPEIYEQGKFDQNVAAETLFFHAKAYEALGDQSVANNDFSGAIEHYTYAIQNLEKVINEQDRFFHDIGEVKNSLSLVEKKKENCGYAVEFFTRYSLDEKNSADSDYLFSLEVISRGWADTMLWKPAVIFNYCLFNQETTGIRRERIIKDLQYTLGRLQSSEEFRHDISSQPVKAVVNDTNVNFRREPVLKDNVIRQFKLFEKVYVMQKSDFTQSIEGASAHWYKICSEDNTEGWIYGHYLSFFP